MWTWCRLDDKLKVFMKCIHHQKWTTNGYVLDWYENQVESNDSEEVASPFLNGVEDNQWWSIAVCASGDGTKMSESYTKSGRRTARGWVWGLNYFAQSAEYTKRIAYQLKAMVENELKTNGFRPDAQHSLQENPEVLKSAWAMLCTIRNPCRWWSGIEEYFADHDVMSRCILQDMGVSTDDDMLNPADPATLE